jgi:hypothetical protein
LLAVPVEAQQQQEEPATLKMDGSPALADPGAPVTLRLLTNYPEEYVGNRSIDNIRIRRTRRLQRENESLYSIQITEIATGDNTGSFGDTIVPFVTVDDRLGRYLLENGPTIIGQSVRLLFRLELFSFETFREMRVNRERPFYCANVYGVEIRDKAGKMVATVP